MNDHILSQEEIDALLKGTQAGDEQAPSQEAAAPGQGEPLLELFQRALERLMPLIPSLAGKPLHTPVVEIQWMSWGDLREQLEAPLAARWDFHGAIQGVQISLVDGPNRALLPILAPAEESVAFLNKLALALATAMEQELGASLRPEMSGYQEVDLSQPNAVPLRDDEQCAAIQLRLQGDGGQLAWWEVLPADVAQQMAERAAARAAAAASAPAAAKPAASSTPVTVAPAQFAPLQTHSAAGTPANINLILDVPLQVTVELGRRRMLIREVLELGKGSLIELDKLAGEPVDVFVNGKLIAKGEVVVIDENFGVKVTSIVSPAERVQNLQ
ncbi:MAG: flagellar motor switch protein FliN [Limnochordales bacterium]|nr:flagellar motor switch protein FliN [Limnochordales bacterium]